MFENSMEYTKAMNVLASTIFNWLPCELKKRAVPFLTAYANIPPLVQNVLFELGGEFMLVVPNQLWTANHIESVGSERKFHHVLSLIGSGDGHSVQCMLEMWNMPLLPNEPVEPIDPKKIDLFIGPEMVGYKKECYDTMYQKVFRFTDENDVGAVETFPYRMRLSIEVNRLN